MLKAEGRARSSSAMPSEDERLRANNGWSPPAGAAVDDVGATGTPTSDVVVACTPLEVFVRSVNSILRTRNLI